MSGQAVSPRAEASGLRQGVGRVAAYLVAVRDELKKVTWPTRDELIKATRTITILALVLGVLIGWLDLLLNLILVDGVARFTR